MNKKSKLLSMLRKVLKYKILQSLKQLLRKNKRKMDHLKMGRCKARMKRMIKLKRLTRLNKSTKKVILNRKTKQKMSQINNLKGSSSNRDQVRLSKNKPSNEQKMIKPYVKSSLYIFYVNQSSSCSQAVNLTSSLNNSSIFQLIFLIFLRLRSYCLSSYCFL